MTFKRNSYNASSTSSIAMVMRLVEAGFDLSTLSGQSVNLIGRIRLLVAFFLSRCNKCHRLCSRPSYTRHAQANPYLVIVIVELFFETPSTFFTLVTSTFAQHSSVSNSLWQTICLHWVWIATQRAWTLQPSLVTKSTIWTLRWQLLAHWYVLVRTTVHYFLWSVRQR